MAPFRLTARMRTSPTQSPEDVIEEYEECAMHFKEDLGEFLARFGKLWRRAHRYGVDDMDGISRLISLLPSTWQQWARMTSRDYIFYRRPRFVYTGDFLRFLGEIQLCYTVYKHAPLGPYILPGDPIPAGGSILPGQPSIMPGMMPPSPWPVTWGHRARYDAEAGPSRPLSGERRWSPLRWSPVRIPEAQAPMGRATATDTSAKRRRRGKAPARTPIDLNDQPATVGTGRLQPLPAIPRVSPVERTSPVSFHLPTSEELKFNAWIVSHFDEMTRGRYRPGGSRMTAIIISSSDDEDFEEEPEEGPTCKSEVSVTKPTTP